jgi:uncharacterized protein DUF6812
MRMTLEDWSGGGIPLPAELVRVSVVLLMDPYLIRGVVHLPPEVARFSDAWESVLSDKRVFIPVTDAEIVRGTEVVLKTPFIHVRKADVRAASPL